MNKTVFIHRSIKTRIETGQIDKTEAGRKWFLYIDPLKQGLKRATGDSILRRILVFIHRSIKTRIETCRDGMGSRFNWVFIHRSIKTRIET